MSFVKSLRADKPTLFAFSACSLMATVAMVMLWKDFHDTGVGSAGSIIATVKHTVSSVRRKPKDSLVWSNIESESGLFKRDSLQTGPGSTAAISLQNGDLVEVTENSLVVMDQHQEIDLSFLKGSFTVHSENGDKKVAVSDTGEVKTERLEVRQLEPKPLSTLFFSKDNGVGLKTVTFKAEIKQPNGEYFLETSRTKNFTAKQTAALKVEGKILSAEIKMETGQFFWRVVQNEKPASAASSFQIQDAFALIPNGPKSSKITVWANDTNVDFKWQKPATASRSTWWDLAKHSIEISKTDSFTKSDFTIPIAQESEMKRVPNLPEGKWYWRLVSEQGLTKSVSNTANFEVSMQQKVPLTLIAPASGASSAPVKEFKFLWDAPTQNIFYKFELVKTDTKQVIKSERTDRDRLLLTDLSPGAYEWHVTAVDKDEHVLGESVKQTFSITTGEPIVLNAPKENEEFYSWKEKPIVEFKWDTDKLATTEGYQYHVQTASDPAFKMGLSESAGTKEFSLKSNAMKIQDGAVYWRVRLVDSKGRIVKESKTARIQYGAHPALMGPESVFPKTGYKQNLDESLDPLKIQWKKVEDATAYEVHIWPIKDGRSPASTTADKPSWNKKVSDLQTVLAESDLRDYQTGNYLWAVRAIDPNGRPGNWSEPQKFHLDAVQELEAPEIQTQEVQ